MKNYLILVLFLSLSCNGKTDKNVYSNGKTDKNIYSNKDIKSEIKITVNKYLLEKIDSFINIADSMDVDTLFKNVMITFYKKNGNCLISLAGLNTYNQKNLIGHINRKNKIVTFYVSDYSCTFNLFTPTDLKKTKISSVPDENSDIFLHMIYEPFGEIYKVHSEDSLELIYRGDL